MCARISAGVRRRGVGAVFREFRRRAAQRFAGAISQRGHGVSKQVLLMTSLPKSMNPRCGSAPSSVTCTRSPTSKPRSPRITRPSTGGSSTRTNTPLGVTPVTTAENGWPTRCCERHRRQALVHVALALCARRLLSACSCARWRPVRHRRRARVFADERLEQPLRHQVGEAAIGRGGMRVIVRRQPEVALFGVARPHQHVLARAPSASAPRARRRRSGPGRPACAASGRR